MTGCEVRRFVRHCRQRGVAVCQYCGRTFCEQHGAKLADGQEICHRPTCQEKRAELGRHLQFKQSAAARNRERLCGLPKCDGQAGGQCSKCQGLFCLRHLKQLDVEHRRGSTVIKSRGSVCRHCRDRRRLWSRS